MEDHATMLSTKHYKQRGTIRHTFDLIWCQMFNYFGLSLSMLLCHTCILHAYMGVQTFAHIHTNTHTNTRTRLLFLQPALLESRRHRPPSPSLVQTCTTKDRKGQTQRPRGLVRNPQVSKQVEGREGWTVPQY